MLRCLILIAGRCSWGRLNWANETAVSTHCDTLQTKNIFDTTCVAIIPKSTKNLIC
jgi:hypothetical protein